MNIETWNENYPAGTSVEVQLDDETIFKTKTRSVAWPIGDGTPVVSLEGLTGGYLLSRVYPVQPGLDSKVLA